MKRINILLVVFVLGLTVCDNDTNGEQTYHEQTHYGNGILEINDAQVWLRNYTTNRLSQAYTQYNEDHDIIVLGEYDKEISGYSDEIGEGTINKGKLSFTVDVPDVLLAWDKLKVFLNTITEGEGWEVDIDVDTVKGTFILILTDDEDEYALMREGVSGTMNSISDEAVYFIYVDGDCTITGGSKVDEKVMYTFNPFTLVLKKGWNTVWYKQTYSTSGRSSFSMDIKNPDLKWVLIPTVPTR